MMCSLLSSPSSADGFVLLDTLVSPNADSAGSACFGYWVAGLGDVSGDGQSDIVVGAPGDSSGPWRQGWYQGRVYVFESSEWDTLYSLDSPCVERKGYFGRSVSGIGDVDDDQAPDLVVGATGENGGGVREAGRAYVFSGATGALIDSLVAPFPQDSAFFGHCVAGIGGVTGHAVEAIIVGVPEDSTGGGPHDAGRSYVFDATSGDTLVVLESPFEQEGAIFGRSVSSAGDTNGDGYPDLIVGACREDSGLAGQDTASGRVYVYSGRDWDVLYTLISPACEVEGHFGRWVSAIGDTDEDDTCEVVIGAPGETVSGKSGAGRAYVFDFAPHAVVLMARLVSPNPTTSGGFGGVVAGVGDVDGDGTPDVAVGATAECGGEGRVYVFSGSDWSLIDSLSSPNAEMGGHFGFVAPAGDVNGDSLPDLVVGACDETVQGTTSAGRAYLFGWDQDSRDGVPVSIHKASGECPAPGVARLLCATLAPGSSATSIRFCVGPGRAGEARTVSIRVYDVAGRRVGEPSSGVVTPGTHSVSLGRGENRGGSLAAGNYFVRLCAKDPDALDVARVIVLR